MSELADESVQMCVTSPPYWGLRKYAGEQNLIWCGKPECEHEWVTQERSASGGGNNSSRLEGGKATQILGSRIERQKSDTCSLCGAWRGAYGLEPTVQMYVDHTVQVLREIRRVLRKDGVAFWNVGDSYSGSGKGIGTKGPRKEVFTDDDIPAVVDSGIPAKNLCLIPFRVALAAQDDGWWVRSVIIWNKPNPMPESVTDRPTDAYEHILMLTKSARYYWDAEAVKESMAASSIIRLQQDVEDQLGSDRIPGKSNGNMKAVGKLVKAGDHKTLNSDNRTTAGLHDHDYQCVGSRNLRNVWTFPTQPYREAHFATFPEELPERCIKAATPEYGCCAKCGAPWRRILEKGNGAPESWNGSRFDDGKNLEVHPNVGRREDARSDGKDKDQPQANTRRISLLRQQARAEGHEYVNETRTIGWEPSCKCGTQERVPSTVLEPFAGSGTTLWVAKKLGRRSVGYDLSTEYCELIVDRTKQSALEI